MMNTKDALQAVLQRNNIDPKEDEFKQYMFFAARATHYVRNYIREEIIRYIAESGIKMDLFGNGWEELGELGNIRVHNPVSYKESVRLCTESKISFNVMPLFKNGLHDRVPTAMLGGSAVITDTSKYMDDIFDISSEDKDLIRYDPAHPEYIGDMIKSALGDVKSLYGIVRRGYMKADKSLSWSSRAKELIALMESV